MRNFLKFIKVIQIKKQNDKFGNERKYYRLNPFNPLSYITLLLVLIIGLILFGFLGFKREIDTTNPFKYQ